MNLNINTPEIDIDDKNVTHLSNWVLSDKRQEPDYQSLDVIKKNNLDWDTIKENILNSIPSDRKSDVEESLNIQQSYFHLRENVLHLKENKGNLDIDLSKEVLKIENEKNSVNENKKSLLEKTVGKDFYEKIKQKALKHTNKFNELKNLLTNGEYTDSKTIKKVSEIAIFSENPTELKAVVMGILENKEKSGDLSNDKWKDIANKYIEEFNITANKLKFSQTFTKVANHAHAKIEENKQTQHRTNGLKM